MSRVYCFFQTCRELFYVLTGAILIFVIMELLWSGIVLAYININWVLIFWLVVGIVILVLENRKQTTDNEVNPENCEYVNNVN